MKSCSTCGLTFEDSQTFCTNDGTPLVTDKSAYDPKATLVAPPGAIPTVESPPISQQGGPPTGWQEPPRPTAPPGFGQPIGFAPPMGPRPGKFVPGLIGAVVTGILCLFADFLPVTGFIFVSFLCIVWSMIGGAVAARTYVNRSPVPVRQGEGAMVGLVAGALGALFYLAIDTLLAYALLGHDLEVFYRSQGQPQVTGGMFFAVSGLFGAIIIVGLSVVGGIIGVAMFEKRMTYQVSMPPPPPPGYGGPMGGYR